MWWVGFGFKLVPDPKLLGVFWSQNFDLIPLLNNVVKSMAVLSVTQCWFRFWLDPEWNRGQWFIITSNGKKLSVARDLDREEQKDYTIQITARDPGLFLCSQTIN